MDNKQILNLHDQTGCLNNSPSPAGLAAPTLWSGSIERFERVVILATVLASNTSNTWGVSKYSEAPTGWEI